jgi:class 3 adenylate cyclase
MSQVVEPPLREQAQKALERHAWADAFELLTRADATGSLAPDELELLAEAAWWTGQLSVAIDARERGFALATKSGDFETAVLLAIRLGTDNIIRQAQPEANGWLNRAERMLEGTPTNPGHGWLAVSRAFQASLTGDMERSLAEGTRAHDVGVELGDADLFAYGLACRGAALVNLGRIDEGLALLDEATVAALGGELQPSTAGGICCAAIETCAALGDWKRATEWTEAQDRWCKREGITGYPGMCRVYRSGVKYLRGSWLEAESEARRASDELQGFMPGAAGMAYYQIGEIRLRRGDLPAAEDALMRAHGFGEDPEPAMSLLRLAQDDLEAARRGIARALETKPEASWKAPPGSDFYHIGLLPAQVEIALAAGDTDTARTASARLDELTRSLPGEMPKARALGARGAVLLATGDADAARKDLEEAARTWTRLDAPYEAARTRVLLADAELAEDEAGRAGMELQTARASFERLGAVRDLKTVDERLSRLQASAGTRHVAPASARVTRAFLFTDIVDSTKLAALMGDEAWSSLIRWHDDTLRRLVAEHGGEEIKATGDGFFLAFDDVDRAIACAIAIQRKLAAHRQSQGFAPGVRIGLHQAEANRSGLDYIGSGVNLAARIAGEAGSSEILVSAGSLAGARQPHAELARRTASLKGVAEPVEVVSLAWQ